MEKLFDKLVTQGNVEEALLVGQNIFNKNSNDESSFSQYFNLLLVLAKNPETDNERRNNYLKRAMVALEFFLENANITEDNIDRLMTYRKDYENALQIVDEEKEKSYRNQLKNRLIENDSIMRSVQEQLKTLINTTIEESFYDALYTIEQLDSKIDKSVFIERQEKQYNDLTKKCSEITDKKVKEFETVKKIKYNQRAVVVFEKTYNLFKNGKEDANHQTVIKEFFSFDSALLFSETLVYFNYVYAYIFNLLSDEDKLNFTRLAIEGKKQTNHD